MNVVNSHYVIVPRFSFLFDALAFIFFFILFLNSTVLNIVLRDLFVCFLFVLSLLVFSPLSFFYKKMGIFLRSGGAIT